MIAEWRTSIKSRAVSMVRGKKMHVFLKELAIHYVGPPVNEEAMMDVN